jgi:hypothetical protein
MPTDDWYADRSEHLESKALFQRLPKPRAFEPVRVGRQRVLEMSLPHNRAALPETPQFCGWASAATQGPLPRLPQSLYIQSGN